MTDQPVDKPEIAVSPGILELTERLARKVHETWLLRRKQDGWVYGPRRDDQAKQHPCILPYDQLPEDEKEYDRETALTTIRTILALGYRIESPRQEELGGQGVTGDYRRDLVDLLNRPESYDLSGLLGLWGARQVDDWPRDPRLYQAAAERFLRLGEPLLAHDAAAEGVRLWPDHLRLRQLKALALSRSRASERALELLEELHQSGQRDEETLGIYARVHKDLAERASDAQRRTVFLRRAYDIYRQAAEATGGYYTAINAATLARVLGEAEAARSWAGRVKSQCLGKLEAARETGGEAYWLTATLAESELILGDLEAALTWYSQAADLAGGRFGDLASTRRNARLLMSAMNLSPAEAASIEAAFQLPKVVVFSGHMIDQPGRPAPRFPARMEEGVKAAVSERVRALDGRIGFSSAACGSDILFLEALAEVQGEAHVVLPYEKEQFIKDSVDIIPGGDWLARFHRVLDAAAEVIVAGERQLEATPMLNDYTNLLLLGLARMRAQQLDTALQPLAVWDGRPGDGPGGTAGMVEHLRRAGYDVARIDVNQVRNGGAKAHAPDVAPAKAPAESPKKSGLFETQLKAMLFADAVGFSKMSEAQVALFVQHFIGAVSRLIGTDYRPLAKETWGDGLFFVFETTGEAGRFALDLCDMVQEEDWAALGLPEDMNFRIALHAGPVYVYEDPLNGGTAYIGIHVTKAARLEPVTPPGQVYATREFAALSALGEFPGFTCEYVGRTPLAKSYGVLPVYHLQKTV